VPLPWDPALTLGTLALGGGYAWAIGPGRARFAQSRQVGRWQAVAYAGAILAVLLALASPLDAISDGYLLSVHMLQHFLLTLVMPPLLLLGLPAWLLRPAFRSWLLGPPLRWLTQPIPAFFAFNVVMTFSHLPGIYNAALEDHRLHVGQHLLYMGTAILTWWPLLSPLPELPRLTYPLRMLYLFAQTVPGALVGAMITYADQPLYRVYELAPRLTPLSVIDDQRLGGLLMWIGVPSYIFILMTITFFVWASDEERRQSRRSGFQAGSHPA
jgi:putative membrane protein